MAEKKINPILKLALELGPVVLFFVMFGRLKDQTFTIGGASYSGFIVTTAAFILLIIATSALLWALTGKLSRMQMMTLVLVVVMGGLSVWLNDERFIKMKPTLLYLAFGGVLGFGLLRGQSYLRLVMDEALPMQAEGWMILTRRLTLGFGALAVANEVVWRTQTTELWVKLETFAFPVVLFVFLMLQIGALNRYMIDPEKDDRGQG